MIASMKRRDFVTLIGGGAAAWPFATRAQQPERMRHVGALMNTAADSADGQARFAAFVQALQQLGWTEGRNARLDVRWAAGDPERIRRYAAELVALAPDVILASGGTTVGPSSTTCAQGLAVQFYHCGNRRLRECSHARRRYHRVCRLVCRLCRP
jgi:hypothetical protein